jgi:hypothetical protein
VGGKRAGNKMEEMARLGSTMYSLIGFRNTARKRGWALHKSRRAWSKTVPRADGAGGGGGGADLSSAFSFSTIGVSPSVLLVVDIVVVNAAVDMRQRWMCPLLDQGWEQ